MKKQGIVDTDGTEIVFNYWSEGRLGKMAEEARNLQAEIVEIINALKGEQERVGRLEKSRLLAIAITHLETAKLFIKETKDM